MILVARCFSIGLNKWITFHSVPKVCYLSNMAYLRHAYWKFISPDPDAKATGY